MPPTIGGVTTFMLNLMSSSLADEFDFRTYTTTRPRKKNVIDNYGYSAVLRGGIARIIQGISLTIWRLAVFPFYLVLRRIDIVQVQASDYQVFWEGAVYVLLARLMGRATLLRIGGHFDHFYSASSPCMQRLIVRALRVPDRLIVQSQFTRSFVEKIAQVPDVLVLPNWSKHRLRPVFRDNEADVPTILFIANMEALRKGVEEVIVAMQRLDAMGVAAKFYLYALAPKLIERISSLKLSNVAVMEGPIDHERLLDLMHRLDIFLLPSHGEGFPNSLIEAMAAGMASVTTPVAGVPEIVADGGAIVIPVGDAAALTGAVARLVSDPEMRRRLGAEARRTIERRYLPASVLPNLAEAYRRLHGNPGAWRNISVVAARRDVGADKPSVLISAPSLDTKINVSGVSSVVLELMAALRADVRYTHLLVGSPQRGGFFGRTMTSLSNNIKAIGTILFSSPGIFHSNTALQRKSIFRDGVLTLVAKARGKRVVLHIHGGRFLLHPAQGLTRAAKGMLMRLADVVVFLSETEKTSFVASMPDIARKSTSIYNSVSMRGLETSLAGNPDNSHLSVVFAGRLVPEKGIETFLAVAKLRFAFPIRFVIYGDGPLRTSVESQARDNPQLEFAGVYDRNEWQHVFENRDILLLPSLFGEGMPMVILEAMSLGVLPIATAIASVPEILGNGERGIIIPPNDTQAIVEAIGKVWSDPAWRLAMRTACRAYARANFDGERNSQRFLEIYHALYRPGGGAT
ncbi:MAG: glycosyltransferase family 4 protein [Rhizomicrobium sp.]